MLQHKQPSQPYPTTHCSFSFPLSFLPHRFLDKPRAGVDSEAVLVQEMADAAMQRPFKSENTPVTAAGAAAAHAKQRKEVPLSHETSEDDNGNEEDDSGSGDSNSNTSSAHRRRKHECTDTCHHVCATPGCNEQLTPAAARSRWKL